jgi:uncharacterized protein YkwD
MRTFAQRGTILPLLLLLAVAAGASPASAATVCSSADAPIAQASTAALANSALCLVNQERTSRGLPALKPNGRLTKAAKAHTRDMVAHNYFAHESLSGTDFAARIRRAGYRAPTLGEDLAWGSGPLGTPRAIVKSWMDSPGHRANILHPKFREAGMGVAIGDPGAGEQGATYTLDFGSGSRK